jgi:hypothetical protein
MMPMKWMLAVLIAMGLAVPVGAAAQAKPESQSASQQQFDVGVGGYWMFTQSSSGLGTTETPTNAPGGLLEIRYIYKPLVGLELNYSLSKSDTTFSYSAATCPTVCGTAAATPTTKLSVKDNNVGVDYVAAAKFGNLQPFALGGIGFNITAAPASTYGVREVIRAAYNVGAGADWGFLPHFGVRVQVRDYLIKAPNNSSLYPATGKTTQDIEPIAGIYYRF